MRVPIVIGSAILLTACGSGGSSSSSDASLNLSITDGPVDSADEVVVEFTSVTLKPAEDDEITIEFDTPKTIDLLDLQGSLSEPLLEDETLPSGNYNWIRLGVSAEFDGIYDSYIKIDDAMYELRVPSGSQSGLKLNTGFTLAAGATANFTIDFDLRKSVTDPGGQPGMFLKPSLRLIDNLLVGSLSGTVDATLISTSCDAEAVNNGAVYLYAGDTMEATDISGAETDPITTALVGETGEYEIGFIETGDYYVAYTCDNNEDNPEVVDEGLVFTDLESVTIEADTETMQDFM